MFANFYASGLLNVRESERSCLLEILHQHSPSDDQRSGSVDPHCETGYITANCSNG